MKAETLISGIEHIRRIYLAPGLVVSYGGNPGRIWIGLQLWVLAARIGWIVSPAWGLIVGAQRSLTHLGIGGSLWVWRCGLGLYCGAPAAWWPA